MIKYLATSEEGFIEVVPKGRCYTRSGVVRYNVLLETLPDGSKVPVFIDLNYENRFDVRSLPDKRIEYIGDLDKLLANRRRDRVAALRRGAIRYDK